MTYDVYVERNDSGYRIRGSRVTLGSIVVAFRGGDLPETIVREAFPTLKLEQVYGAIAFYLSHRAEVDAYLDQERHEYERLREVRRQADPEMTRRFAEAREELRSRR